MLPQQALLKILNWLKWKSQKIKLVKAMLANITLTSLIPVYSSLIFLHVYVS